MEVTLYLEIRLRKSNIIYWFGANKVISIVTAFFLSNSFKKAALEMILHHIL